MIPKKIAIIGVGNMGGAIARSLIETKQIEPQNLILTSLHIEKLQWFAQHGCQIITSNTEACRISDVIILAIKPQIIPTVSKEIANILQTDQLIISIAAGITLSNLSSQLSSTQPIARAMPLLTAKINQSVTCWITNPFVTKDQKNILKQILSTIGIELEVDTEDKIDAFTAIAGAPAYVFYLAELLENSAIELGFSKEETGRIIPTLLYGSAQLLKDSNATPQELRRQVTSKGGTTEEAIRIFEEKNLSGIIHQAILSSLKRAKKLGT